MTLVSKYIFNKKKVTYFKEIIIYYCQLFMIVFEKMSHYI